MQILLFYFEFGSNCNINNISINDVVLIKKKKLGLHYIDYTSTYRAGR